MDASSAIKPPPPPPQGVFNRENTHELEGLKSFEEIKQLAAEGRADIATRGLSRSLSHALRRGESLAEKKSAWPFDLYQCTNMYPVDYTYWARPIQTSTGESRLITMHAHAYTSEGEEFAADQVYHRSAMKGAHNRAIQKFLDVQESKGELAKFAKKTDKWGRLQMQLLKKKAPMA